MDNEVTVAINDPASDVFLELKSFQKFDTSMRQESESNLILREFSEQKTHLSVL